MAAITESFGWAGVELRHLVALETVAEERSFAAAARRLGYSQPAVSQQLASLERLVGTRLVERRPGGREVTLTEAGERVLLHGAAMLARARAAEADLRELGDGSAGTLRLGAFPSVGARVVPQLLRRFATRWPQVELQLVEDASDRRLLDEVEAGALDLAFAMLPLEEGPLACAELLRDPYVLLVAAGSPLAANGARVSLRRLPDLPLIVCAQTVVPEALLRAHGIAARIRFRIHDNETIVGLTAAGLGAALVPRLTVDPVRTDVVALDLAVELPPRLIGIAWHRDRRRSDCAEDLVETARMLCAEV